MEANSALVFVGFEESGNAVCTRIVTGDFFMERSDEVVHRFGCGVFAGVCVHIGDKGSRSGEAAYIK